MKKNLFLLFSVAAIISSGILFSTKTIMGDTSGPSAGKCGAPSDNFTNCTSCHNGTATSTTGWITSNIPASGYIPGNTYTITATATYPALVRYGFQISPQNTSGVKLGTLVITNSTATKLVGTGKYVEHTSAGTTGSTGSHTWTFNWIAPAAGSGPVNFYGAFNCANNNGGESGDHIYLSTLSVNQCNVTAAITNANPALCATDSNTLVASGGNNFIWNTGATSSSIKVLSGTYTVTVSNGTSCSATSSINLTVPVCAVPTNDTATSIQSTKATISWTGNSCAAGYSVQIRQIGATAWSTLNVTAPTSSKLITGLLPLTTYEYHVRTNCNSAGTIASAYTAIKSFSTPCTCAKPSAISVTGITSTSAAISGTGNSCAVKYRVQYRALGTTTWITKTTLPPSTTKTLTGLIANTTYQYRMRSDCNSTGSINSGYTTIGTFTTSARMESVGSDIITNKINIFPNPTQGKFLVTIISSNEDNSIIRISDVLGREIINENVSLIIGENNFDFSLENYPSGMFLLELKSSEGGISKKTILKN